MHKYNKNDIVIKLSPEVNEVQMYYTQLPICPNIENNSIKNSFLEQ